MAEYPAAHLIRLRGGPRDRQLIHLPQAHPARILLSRSGKTYWTTIPIGDEAEYRKAGKDEQGVTLYDYHERGTA